MDLINRTESSLKIATAHFRRPDFYQAIIDAHERGVKVEMVSDQQEFSSSRTRCHSSEIDLKRLDECLSEQGIDVRWKTYETNWYYRTAKQMHLKYIISDDSEVLTGSFNYSFTAEVSKMETLVRLKGDEAKPYLENFKKVFDFGRQDDGVKKLFDKAESSTLCYWPPVSLNAAEYRALRRKLNKPACPNLRRH